MRGVAVDRSFARLSRPPVTRIVTTGPRRNKWDCEIGPARRWRGGCPVGRTPRRHPR